MFRFVSSCLQYVQEALRRVAGDDPVVVRVPAWCVTLVNDTRNPDTIAALQTVSTKHKVNLCQLNTRSITNESGPLAVQMLAPGFVATVSSLYGVALPRRVCVNIVNDPVLGRWRDEVRSAFVRVLGLDAVNKLEKEYKRAAGVGSGDPCVVVMVGGNHRSSAAHDIVRMESQKQQ